MYMCMDYSATTGQLTYAPNKCRYIHEILWHHLCDLYTLCCNQRKIIFPDHVF